MENSFIGVVVFFHRLRQSRGPDEQGGLVLESAIGTHLERDGMVWWRDGVVW